MQCSIFTLQWVFWVILGLPLASFAQGTSNVRVQGEYRSGEFTNPFEAVLSHDAIRIEWAPQSMQPGMAARYGLAANQELWKTNYVDRQVSTIAGTTPEPGVLGVRLRDARYGWELGSIGSREVNQIFLTLRARDLFPSVERPGRRRLAPTWELPDVPAALVTEAYYRSEQGRFGEEILGEVIPSAQLLRVWRKSPYLGVNLVFEMNRPVDFLDQYLVMPTRRLLRRPTRPRDGLRRELAYATQLLERDLDSMAVGQVVEAFRLHSFTNVGGIEFPMVGEFTRFHSSVQAPADAGIAGSRAERVQIRRAFVTTESPTIAPLRAANMHVSEDRLNDRKLGIPGVRYQTNELVTLEIARSAATALEFERDKVRRQFRQAWRERAIILVGWVVLVLSPFLGAWFWFVGKGSEKTTRGWHARHRSPRG